MKSLLSRLVPKVDMSAKNHGHAAMSKVEKVRLTCRFIEYVSVSSDRIQLDDRTLLEVVTFGHFLLFTLLGVKNSPCRWQPEQLTCNLKLKIKN